MSARHPLGAFALLILLASAAAPAAAQERSAKAPTLSGVVWIDSDRDGVRDRGESRAVRALAKLERARRRGGRRVFRVVARDRTNRKGK